MCDPVSLSMVTIAAGGLTAAGQYQQGQSASNYYKYNANMAEQQAQMEQETAEKNVSFEQEAGKEQSKSLARQLAKVGGAQQAAMGSQGIAGGTTAAALIGESLSQGELDEQAIRYNADSRSWMLREQAKNKAWTLNQEASMNRSAAKNMRVAGNLAASGTILSTAAQVGGIWEDSLGKSTKVKTRF